MNLELSFDEATSPLDQYLAEIDRALDAIFLGEVDDEVARLRAEREASDDDDAARVA